jgi:hypothetical protein
VEAERLTPFSGKPLLEEDHFAQMPDGGSV